MRAPPTGAPAGSDWDAFTGYRDREQTLPEDDAAPDRTPGTAKTTPPRGPGAPGPRSVGYRQFRRGAR